MNTTSAVFLFLTTACVQLRSFTFAFVIPLKTLTNKHFYSTYISYSKSVCLCATRYACKRQRPKIISSPTDSHRILFSLR